jgi:hypothetical protein
MTKMTMVVLIAVSLVGCKKKKAEEAAATASGSAAMGSAMGSATEQAAGSAAAGSAAAGSATTGSATMTGSAAAAGDSAKELALDAPMDAGNGVMLTFSKKETAKGGDNQPPTYQHKVVAKCGGKDVVVIDRTDEGGDGKVSVEQQPGKAIVTMNVHIAREGEIADEKEAAQLDLATCAVAKQ